MKKGLVLSGGGGRGAYQAGVYKYLSEIGYIPDAVCGASVGAINAVAIASGLSSAEIEALWKSISPKKVMKYSYWKIVKNFFLRRFAPIADNTPLRHFLESKINFTELPKSKMDVFIPAVNILTSELVFFDKKEIGVDHILASTAIPIIFPWQQIGENYYWDGGVMANTPILPLIQRDIRDIIIVILSPVGNIKLELPKNRKEAIERSFELSLIASFENFKSKIGYKKENSIQSIKSLSHTFLDILYGVGEFRFRIVSPNESLGVTSILNFSGEQAQRLIDMGYNDAKAQLSEE